MIPNQRSIGCEGQPRADQRNHHPNSMTGTQIETTAKGAISRSAVYEHHNDIDGSSRQLG